MTYEIAIVLTLLLAAVVLFAAEWLPVDLVTLLLLLTLAFAGVLSPQQVFSGFASEIIVVLASIFVISGAVVQTGAMAWLGRWLYRAAGRTEAGARQRLMALSAAISAVLSNTSATAIMLPASVELARRNQFPPGRLLMPMAYASVLGGTCTVIGTSTNIAASGFIEDMGLAPYGMFEFAPVGLMIALAGLVYMSTLGARLMPTGQPWKSLDAYPVQNYLSELTVPEGSRAAGRSLGQIDPRGLGLMVDAIVRDAERLEAHGNRKLQPGDRLLVHASRDDLLAAIAELGLELASGTGRPSGHTPAAIGEAVLMPQSRLIGKTLGLVDLPRRFGLTPLALYRRGRAYPSQLTATRLLSGDVILLQGADEEFAQLEGNPDLWGLRPAERAPQNPRRGLLLLALLLLAVVMAAFGWLPLSLALLATAAAAVLLRCITMEDAYHFIEWRLLVLIAGMTAFGLAMHETGAADWLARLILDWTLPLGPLASLAALAFLTMLLTQPMSNAAAALVVLPVALAAAGPMGVDPRPVAVLTTLAASLTFVTPLEPACLLVYGPGKYRFADFVRVGAPLTLIALLILILLVPILWPL